MYMYGGIGSSTEKGLLLMRVQIGYCSHLMCHYSSPTLLLVLSCEVHSVNNNYCPPNLISSQALMNTHLSRLQQDLFHELKKVWGYRDFNLVPPLTLLTLLEWLLAIACGVLGVLCCPLPTHATVQVCRVCPLPPSRAGKDDGEGGGGGAGVPGGSSQQHPPDNGPLPQHGQTTGGQEGAWEWDTKGWEWNRTGIRWIMVWDWDR